MKPSSTSPAYFLPIVFYLIIAAIGDVSRARGISRIAEDTSLGMESLSKSLSQEGNPSFTTVMKVMASLGFGLSPRLVSEVQPTPPAGA
ncbi:MAG: putative addiction module antidote protein [Treponema sp.]|jgi:DNA-binding phage protein|nr:putative addiction module antidote protein [Treponema sp.]